MNSDLQKIPSAIGTNQNFEVPAELPASEMVDDLLDSCISTIVTSKRESLEDIRAKSNASLTSLPELNSKDACEVASTSKSNLVADPDKFTVEDHVSEALPGSTSLETGNAVHGSLANACLDIIHEEPLVSESSTVSTSITADTSNTHTKTSSSRVVCVVSHVNNEQLVKQVSESKFQLQEPVNPPEEIIAVIEKKNETKLSESNGDIRKIRFDQHIVSEDFESILSQQKHLEKNAAPVVNELEESPQIEAEDESMQEVLSNLNEAVANKTCNNPYKLIGKILGAQVNLLYGIKSACTEIQSSIEKLVHQKDVDTLATPTSSTSSSLTSIETRRSEVTSMSYEDLEKHVSASKLQLEQLEENFEEQEDKAFVDEKLHELYNAVKKMRTHQDALDGELEFIKSQQKAVDELIIPLASECVELASTPETYNIQAQELAHFWEIIEAFNDVRQNRNSCDPFIPIHKILSAQEDTLQWIKQSSAEIKSILQKLSFVHDSLIDDS